MQQFNNLTFVSRGGIKLQAALDQFKIDVKNKVVLDVGSSIGGFVDCLLQNGAKKVYAVDTAYGELAWKLRNDPKVVVIERTNILYLENLPSSVIPAKAVIHKNNKWILNQACPVPRYGVQDDDSKVDIVTIDAGWTKLELVLPTVKKFLRADGKIIALLKPHYETDKKNLVKGVVKRELVEQVKNEVIKRICNLGFNIQAELESPILGVGGNTEFLLFLVQGDN